MEILAQSRLFDWLLGLAGNLPRAKSALPRLLGRIFVRDRGYEVKMPRGYQMVWPSCSIDALASHRRLGVWDDHVLAALQRETRPGSVIYDIGANAGYMTLSLAATEPECRIVAFEPIPQLAEALRQSCVANGFNHVEVLGMALGERDAQMQLYLPSHAIHASFQPRGNARAIDVPVRTLDRLLEEESLAVPDLIKIDVEGAEMMLFRGAAETLRRYKPTIVFECDENSQRFGHQPGDAITFLAELGYDQFSRILPDGSQTALDTSRLDRIAAGDFRASWSGREK